MLVKILKPFHHSDNGIHSTLLRPSDDPDHRVEIRDELCAGLSGDGYIDGGEHGLPLLSPGRKEAIIRRIIADGRVQLAKLPDEQLLRMDTALDEAKVKADAEQGETRVEAAAVETTDGNAEAAAAPAVGTAAGSPGPAEGAAAVETVSDKTAVKEAAIAAAATQPKPPATPKAKKAPKPAAKA